MTPIQAESERFVNELMDQNATPGLAQSMRSAYTPGYELGFSPNGQFGSPAFYASPAHCQQSPGYGSPIGVAGSSPIYVGAAVGSPAYNAQSPIYQPPQSITAAGSHQRLGQSPQYSPNSISSPRAPLGGQQPYSPVYNPAQAGASIGKSPGYSPANMGRMVAPSPMNPNQSPAYSPSSLGK